MKKLPLVDLLSLAIILAIGFNLYRIEDRLHRLEKAMHGTDPLESAALLPMPAATAAGHKVTVESGSPKLIFFMSPHCGVCGRNMPVWSAIAHRIGKDHTLFLVAKITEMPEMPEYLTKNAVSGFPTVAADSEVVSRYYMSEVPKTVLVAPNGTVVKVWRGVVTNAAVLEGWAAIMKK